jgi:hypothetical protein
MPLEGRFVMPEETETQTTEQPEAEETVDTSAAAEDDSGTETDTDDGAQEAQTTSDDDGFDRKKFEAELRKKNSEAQNLRKRLKELEPLARRAKELEDAQKSETERLSDQLRAANERIEATRKRLVTSQVKVLATAFADPDDAVGALDLDSYVDDDGDIDEAAIKADLDALLERKPHWARTQPQEGPRRPAPDRTQASGAKQTRTLTPEDEFQGWLKTQLK